MTRRGQMVVLAAALIAVALVPMVAAYLQLSYQPTVDERAAEPTAAAERALSDALPAATDAAPAANWSARANVSLAVERALAPTIRAIERSGPPDAATRLSLNDTAADRVARTACPSGPNRDFGDCEGSAGVVVQFRGNRTHVVAVAVDVSRVGPAGRTEATLIVRR